MKILLGEIEVYDHISCIPSPEPKKGENKWGGVYYVDKSEKVFDPKTGKMKRKSTLKWITFAEAVRDGVAKQMLERGIKILLAPLPFKISMSFYLTQPKSNKDPYPSRKPDFSNMHYGIENALSEILYFDDGQRIGTLPEELLWATKENPPGIRINFQRVQLQQRKLEI